MYLFLKKNHRLLFFISWLLINLIQAYSTELFDDEAYYWVYSKFPAWGYFDHPPAIALLIKAGYAIFQNELGVRFFIVLANTATIYLTSKLIDNRNDKLFYAIALSIGIAQIGGMIAVPDVPLLFFSAVFFMCYKRFVSEASSRNIIFLAVAIALMLYTKYHGILIILFTLFSNIRLLAKYQTHIVGALATLLLAPHIYWQVSHDYPSVYFHLFERNASTYRLAFTSEYLLGQVALAGPIIGWLLIWAAVRYKPLTKLERALQFTLIGFYLFFLVTTLKGRVEANWTIPCFIALIVLSHQYLNNKPRIAKWLYNTLPISLLIIGAVRVYMMLDVETNARLLKDEFHQNKVWVDSMASKSGGQPLVFLDSYQRPSKFWFYSGYPGLGLNTPAYRRNNYNFWPLEDSYRGKAVYVVGSYDSVLLKDTIITPRFRSIGGTAIPRFYSFMKSTITGIRITAGPNTINTSFDLEVPEDYLSCFQQFPYDTAAIQLAVLNVNDSTRYYPSDLRVKQIKRASSRLSVNFAVALPKGSYNARLGISSAVPGHPSLNSTSFRFRID